MTDVYQEATAAKAAGNFLLILYENNSIYDIASFFSLQRNEILAEKVAW